MMPNVLINSVVDVKASMELMHYWLKEEREKVTSTPVGHIGLEQ
jgi:hypothetical protein